jgi:acyl-CoA synthetase (AMP-forming)/AMP-acid ligase II
MSDLLLAAWEKTVRRNQNNLAVGECATGRRVTFQQLDECASAWLRAQEIEAVDLKYQPVVYSATNGIGWLEIFLGLLKAHAVIIPLDAAEPAAAQKKIAEAVGALCALPDDAIARIPLV